MQGQAKSPADAIHTFRALGVQAPSAASAALRAPCMRPERVSPIKSRNELEDSGERRFSHAGPRLVPAHLPNPKHTGVLNWRVYLGGLTLRALEAPRPLRLIPLDWTYRTHCASSEALRWKYATVKKKKRGARSEEAGCHLLFRSSCASLNCASVCICGDNLPQVLLRCRPVYAPSRTQLHGPIGGFCGD